MRITISQLKKLIREGIDLINNETGELMVFEDDWESQGGHGPEAAAYDALRRLQITPLQGAGPDISEEGIENVYLDPEDWAVVHTEFEGKRDTRRRKKIRGQAAADAERLNVDSLMDRVRAWASDIGQDLATGNMGVEGDPEMYARDLALNAEFEFQEDEWDEMVWHFDNNEDFLIDFIADEVVSASLITEWAGRGPDELSFDDIAIWLEDRANEYKTDKALGPAGIQELLMDDFMDDLGAYQELTPDIQDEIDYLSGMLDAEEESRTLQRAANRYGEQNPYGINEGTLYVSRNMYGASIVDDQGEYFGIGEMIRALLNAGDDDFFTAPQGVDPKALQKLMQQDKENDQGSIENWDNDVFSDYYSVDQDRVIRLYARLMNYTVEEVADEPEESYDDPYDEDLEQAARDEYEFESYYS